MTDLQKKSLNTIELYKVLDMLASEAASQKAKERARELTPAVTLFECERLLNQCADAVKLMGTKNGVRWPAPSLGQHNSEVYSEMMGFDQDKLQELKENGVI